MTQEKKLWFSAKQFGFGWCPCSNEGWMATLLYLILAALPVIWLGAPGLAEHLVEYIIYDFVLTAILIWICSKTGEKPRWQWGKKK